MLKFAIMVALPIGYLIQNGLTKVTLNITLVSRKVIYQSGDYRLTDMRTLRPLDFMAQKQILLNRFGWSAVVAFAGVGHTGRIDVAEWLSSRASQIAQNASFQGLISVLLEADRFLCDLPLKFRRHTFSVGAFVGSRPFAALVSNWESLHALPASITHPQLAVSEFRPGKPRIMLAGSGASAVSQQDRQALLGLLRKDPPPDEMYRALAEANARAAAANKTVSPACFISHIRFTGEGGGMVHRWDEAREFLPSFVWPKSLGLTLNPARDEQGNPKAIKIGQMITIRAPSGEHEYRQRLKERPNDPELHNNYGVFLLEKRNDPKRAEEEYRIALHLNPNYSQALGNIANLRWHVHHDVDEAENHYQRALAADPANSIHRNNYAWLLVEERHDDKEAERLFREGLAIKSDDEALLHGLADFHLRRREYGEAVPLYERYLKTRPDDADALAACAVAMTLTGGSRERSIALYRRALSNQPDHALALVNLAQLLFIDGHYGEATDLLRRCLGTGPSRDIKLECWFYRYAHIEEGRDEALKEVKDLILAGIRSPEWDLSGSVQRALHDGHPDGALVQTLANVVSGHADADALAKHSTWNAH